MKKLVLLFSLFLSTPLVAQAQTELAQPSGYVGVNIGLASPTNLSSRFGYGANAGLSFPYGLTGGIFFLNSKASDSGTDVQLMHYGFEGAYRFALTAADIPEPGFGDAKTGLKVGGRIGMATAKTDTSGVSTTNSSFTVGPMAGYDFAVAPGVSIGVDTSVMFSFGDAKYSTLYVLGSGKYWF